MPIVSLRASDFDAATRVAAFQDAVSAICKLEIVPDEVDRFTSETVIGVLPTLVTGVGIHSACRAERTARLAAETGDNLMIHIPVAGGFSMHQDGGAAVECAPGTVYVDPHEVPGRARFHGERSEVFYVSLPRGVLASCGTRLDRMLRGTSPLTPQWRLFSRYARALHDEMAGLSADETMQCAVHVQDLALLALGADRDSAEQARGRGGRAARLAAIKADIETHLTEPGLSVDWITARHRISERYLRALFAGEETSFRDYVTARRLLLAYRELTDPAASHRSVADIALSCGFGDVSWFNALFKRAFAATPRDVRALAAAGVTRAPAFRDAPAGRPRPA